MEERLVTGDLQPEDSAVETTLRPHTLREYVGQQAVKDSLSIYIQAALTRHDALDHMLLYGPPGLGKTTLATIVAAEMEDFAIDIMIGKGPTARSIRVAVPKFTLVGATTRAGQLSAPLRDRFGILFRLEMYKPEELAQIVRRSASILEIDAEDAGIMEIARRSRGTPRIANRMLKRVRDYAQVRGGGVISLDVAREAIAMQGVDELGLDKVDRAVLGTMMDKFGGGPVGLDTLAATTGEDAVTIEDVYEPYLMQLGFLMRTPRGRMCTPAAWEHMKRTPPGQGNDNQLKMEL